MPIPRDLLDRWTKRRDELRRLHAAVDGATLCEEVLADLDAIQRAEGDVVLTLVNAAMLSGYSAEHLARLLRTGVLPNAGRKGAPRIRLADLPKRPSASLAAGHLKRYDPDADARALQGVR